MKRMYSRLCALLAVTLALGLASQALAIGGAERGTGDTVAWYGEDGAVRVRTEDSPDGADAALMDGEGLIQLSAPQDLQWGRSYRDHSDAASYDSVPGMGSWKIGAVFQNQFAITYYRKTASGDERVTDASWEFSYIHVYEGACCSDGKLLTDPYPSGDYYFTVQALGDGVQYADSEIAVSPVWHYDAPSAQIPPVGKPVWKDDRTVVWEPSSSEYAYAYDIDYCIVRDERYYGGDFWSVGGTRSYADFDPENTLEDWVFEEGGSGEYFVRVRVISSDITKYLSSEWSERSDTINISDSNSDLSEIVFSVYEGSSLDEKQSAIESVRNIGADELAAAMAADFFDTGATADIARLEELTGSQSAVEVSPAMTEVFGENEVSVVGAGLNVDVGQSVTLKVGEADPHTVVPTMYQNTVQFSMHLEDAAGADLTAPGAKLAVPVKITLPVPAGINPEFLVILHHHADGSYEEIQLPRIHGEIGHWYVTFLVRSFSDFTIAESREMVKASRWPTGIFVSGQIAGGEATSVWCAVYDEAGGMLGVEEMPLTGGTAITVVPCDSARAASVKVFTWDENTIPTAPARTPVL